MTPKQQANYLVNNQIDLIYEKTGFHINSLVAKESQLISVDKIIEILTNAVYLNLLYKSELVVYWNEVRKEIEAL
jgi:hypothetical protein